MSFYTDIRAALVAEVLLGDAADYPMLHDNATLDNQTDTWLSINFTPIANRSATQGRTGQDEASGFMQVNVNAPQGHGSIDGLTLADSIASQFERGSTLTAADVTVVVEGATLAPSIFSEDGNTYITPITIDWRARRRRDADSYTPPPVLCPGPSELCQPPQFSSALSLNGADQYVEVSSNLFPNTGECVFEFWANISSSNPSFSILWAISNNAPRFIISSGQIKLNTHPSTVLGSPLYDAWVLYSFRFNDGDLISVSIGGAETWSGLLSSSFSLFNFLRIAAGNSTGGSIGNPDFATQMQIAHASINGVSIPFNNVTPYDLTFNTDEKTVVNYINDPVQTTQKVVHKEFEFGYFAAVRGDGATGAIDSGISMDQVTSCKFRFIASEHSGTTDSLFGVNNGDGERMYVFHQPNNDLSCIIGSTGNTIGIPTIAGSEYEIELRANGEVYLDGVLQGNTGGSFASSETSRNCLFLARLNDGGSLQRDNAIALQAWVNGNVIDIHDQSKHIGTVSEHRLIDYP